MWYNSRLYQQKGNIVAVRNPIVKQNEVVEGTIVGSGCMVMTASEYDAYSKSNGRIFGREVDAKTPMTSEEFVVLHNSGWSPKMMMDKHGLTLEELQNVASNVAKIQQLARPIKVTEKLIQF